LANEASLKATVLTDLCQQRTSAKDRGADHFEFSPRDVERDGPGVPHSGDQ
jgi:hypothetical protein